ncbi:DNA polymerase III subunit gamma and tau [Corynebacterium sp. ES2794-CONJ1]|uniref:DNA polymerase III subunit gamma and tau n=1 Tax=unclassified Corynebacterium TaxID=2624378 RepID=UPI00216B5853|nr:MULTISPECIES: DNA polymerase III subunit gamma and tau [unclassified Corynebacterium]MCS4532385.1 DNA polymerase III subunit gamma and tau [Corynebacterium sp. ES2730-CONJ]MCU9519652.1 DNA polymerase III subunit gamma and tau [Corynebacterium sp. ES2794-CONJ1]
MALYRKYRPGSFGELLGQDQVTIPLSRALDNGRINHAYLFSGPRGCGKTSSARIMARSLNCVKGPTSHPCGVCPSCVALAPNGSGTLDVTELDAASNNSVDDMRELRDRAMYAPAESRYRIFIIDEAHMVTRQGSNALLKIVEEPPEHLIFIFATTEPEKVISTIRSRTHHYPFRLLSPQAMRTLLERTAAAEGMTVEDSVYPLVIRQGGGSPRDTLSVLDQLFAGAGPEGLTYEQARLVLGATDEALIDSSIEALANHDSAQLFRTVDTIIEAGLSPRRFAEDLLDRLRDLIVIQAVPQAVESGLVDAPTDRGQTLLDQAEAFDKRILPQIAGIFNDGLSSIKGATSPRLLLEILCAKMLVNMQPPAEINDDIPRYRRRAGAPAAPVAKKDPAPIAAKNPALKPEDSTPAATREGAHTPHESAPAAPPEVIPEPAQPAPSPDYEAQYEKISAQWQTIRSLAAADSQVLGILLTEAYPMGVRDGQLILGHTTGALANRLNAGVHATALKQAVKKQTGLELTIKCEVAIDPKELGFSHPTRKAAPVWTPTEESAEEVKPPAKDTPLPNEDTQPPAKDTRPSSEDIHPPAEDDIPLPPEPEEDPWGEPAALGGEPEDYLGENVDPLQPESVSPDSHTHAHADTDTDTDTDTDVLADAPEDIDAESGDEESALMDEAASEPGSHDHRSALAYAMDLLAQELGAKPV